MHITSVYQLVATILPNGIDGEKVQHDLGIWTTLRDAKRQMKEFVKDGDFFCPVYCYSIQFLPLDNDLDYQSERKINVYSPDGKLQIKEFNMVSCGAGAAAPRTDSGRSSLCIGGDTATKRGDGGGKEEGATSKSPA